MALHVSPKLFYLPTGMEYDFSSIEERCKKLWAEQRVYEVSENPSLPKLYILDMFPYPSGAGLHVGHPLGYVASDIYARYKRMKGYNVLHPMGYDAFGLPAEQYAIETGTHPAVTTEKAIKTFRAQMDKIGFSYDWSREIKTCDPAYYKWTQWMFLRLFNSWYNREHDKAEDISTLIARFEKEGCHTGWKQYDPQQHPPFTADDWKAFSFKQRERILQCYRLAYRSFTEVNWCEALGCVLANDEVKDGKSERGGHPVTRKKMRQWSLRITEYAERLLEGLNRIDWSESIKEQQRNWIGRSEGCLIKFNVQLSKFKDDGLVIEVFTTRPDTIFGVTFLVLAPEHELLPLLTTREQKAAMDVYLQYVKSRSDVERQQEKKITGCFTGTYALHPFTGKEIPIWTAEYVLAGYGTGAIMAVPADDERDRRFAEKFGLPVIEIIDKSMYPGAGIEDKVGRMINSDFLNGMEVADAIQATINRVEKLGIGKRQVNYKLRDASFSRQRYWGEPFPIRYLVQERPDSPFVEENDPDEADIPVALSESELPLLLPDVQDFRPTGDGRSPLAKNEEWIKCHYETDTMPGYAGSSWYFLRYTDPHNPNAFASKDKLRYWQNVDVYFGGAEHAVGHLLYSRFLTKVLFDLGEVMFDEPFKKLVNQGMIQGVSKFIYRLFAEYAPPGASPQKILENYYISKDVYLSLEADGELRRNDAWQRLSAEAGNELNCDVNTAYIRYSVQLVRINVALTEGDVLDEEKLKAWRTDYATAKFIRNAQGQVLCHAEVEKMSKSKHNVVNPDDVIARYGADCFRMFEMFLGPLEQSKPWDDKGINGVFNFLKKFWRLYYDDKGWRVTDNEPDTAAYKILHKTIKKVTDDIERLNFNTCVSAMMIAVNELTAIKCNSRKILEPLALLIAPFAPFVAEELWQQFGNSGSVHLARYPVADAKYLAEDEHTYPVSVNGKVRAEIILPANITSDEAKARVLALEQIQKWTNGNAPKKFIFVPGKIINLVV
ncbi:MAG: leucine--tRNA ligase [Chitinophagales bacterium]|nr:leucine--tRNA ligase [Chitinophagales bacterium]MDW8419153.1 class I tRNA ligase family protein [Chitinophagales bacterium]